MTLAEAVELGLRHNHALHRSRLDSEAAGSQVDEAWSSVYPRLDLTLRYTRTVESPDPFAGSDAGSFFQQSGALGWLAFNEGARTDGDPATEPISLADFQQRQARGLSAAGADLGSSDNPFLVPNRFDFSVGLTQTLYNARAFAAIRGAEVLLSRAEAAEHEARRQLAAQIARRFFGALLARARADVLARSVTRTVQSVDDTRRRVEQGVAPRFEQLSAEVELANLRTQLLASRDAAASTVEGLLRVVGLPVTEAVAPRGELALKSRSTHQSEAMEVVMSAAETQRPDLLGARLGVALSEVRVEIAEAGLWPVLSLFANAGYTGTVPDDRERVVGDPADPFSFDTTTDGVFDDRFWGANVNIGVQLVGNLFDGWGTTARTDRDRLEARRARSYLDELRAAVAIELRAAQRQLHTAEARIESQEQNLARAVTNYEHAKVRVAEGVSTPLELRSANQQLDLSRLNHLQAVHDYLVAWIALEVAMGAPPQAVARIGERS